jgi:dihydroxy-acid dehydratase
VVLHVAPEAAAGGPLAFVRTGDIITVDLENRTLSMDVTDDELQSRSQSPASEAAYANPARGWQKLYVDHVMQADTGADLDILIGSSGAEVSRESH